MIDSGVNTRVDVVDDDAANANVYSDNTALSAGMYVRVSDVNNSANCTYYTLTTAISTEMTADSTTMQKIEERITASRTVKTYRTEVGKTAKLIAASYDASNKLIGISIDEKDISSAGIYKFNVGVTEGETTKIMLWLNNMKPYDAPAVYDEE